MVAFKKLKRLQKIVIMGLLLLLPVTAAAWGGAGLSRGVGLLPEELGEWHESQGFSWQDLSAKAENDYQGDGLSVEMMAEEACLRSVFQALEGEISAEGLWVISTSESEGGGSFTLKTAALGRVNGFSTIPVPGTVTVEGGLARLDRLNLIEEYSVSLNGIRQDFILSTPPPGEGELRLELALTGAEAVATGSGALLTLTESGRVLSYDSLYVTDSAGRQLPARLAVPSVNSLEILVEDWGAVYPVRIDPTISDADWSGMGELGGFNRSVSDLVLDSQGNLYAAGEFTEVGGVEARRIARWNGSSWVPE